MIYNSHLLKSGVCRLLLGAIAATFAATGLQASEAKTELTLKQVMSDPDWMGRSPQSPYWSDDGKTVLFQQKIKGHQSQQLMSVALSGGKPQVVANEELDTIDRDNGDLNANRTLKAYLFRGDVFVKNLQTGDIYPVTQTLARESQVNFMSDGRISFRRDNSFFAYDMMTGRLAQLAEVKLAEEPEDWKEPRDFLGAQQRRLFDYIKTQQDERQFKKQQREQQEKANQFIKAKTFYLGKKIDLDNLSLSPSGEYIFAAVSDEQSGEGEQDNMPRFVTDDGYVENEKVRTLVGQRKPVNQRFYLLDLKSEKKFELNKEKLEGIDRDPLAALKKKAAERNNEAFKKDSSPRAIYIHGWGGNGVEWSQDGKELALKLYAYDNKDRWLARVNFNNKALETLHRLTDNAWVNDWTFNQMGWLNNHNDFYFLSEHSGYSHLYLKKKNKRIKALTKGKFEVSDLTLTHDDAYIYYRANKKHPGIHEVYRVELASGKNEAVTDLGGNNDYVLSPDESQLLITHSTVTKPQELYVKSVTVDDARQLTNTVSNAFKSIQWTKPDIIEVPSSHTDEPIYSRLYLPENFDKQRAGKYPAVMFVHGAGYLQNAHQGWSGYFREFMFHSLLTRMGYVVLDMDYRASKGYGRDWRTAIYRQMGTPELEDLLDGKQWLLKNANVEADKVGIYGGSYGGFMTFMALFNAPGEFAAGASLRPVTDWSSYNHGYTSNILNTPEVDPEAYNISSPIEYAEGLSDPLLIAHGMVDDNVFFKDSVRLVQRLIELEKTPLFETAIYPVEPHGFREPSSWLDEYTRILMLFEDNLK